MEWPYDHPRRGDMPPDRARAHASTSTRSASRPTPRAARSKNVYSYVQGWAGSDYSKNIVVDEKEHPYTGTNYAWVRARVPRRQDEHLGPARAAPVRLRLQGARPATATARTGRSPTPTSRRTTTRSIATSASPASPRSCRTCPTASSSGRPRLNAAEIQLREALATMGRVLTPYRAGVTTDGLKHNKYRSRCFGRGACGRRAGRLRHPRRVRLADRAHLPGDGHRPPHGAHRTPPCAR